jgi:putative glutamine amidotransferase
MADAPVVAIVIGREPDHRYSVHRAYVDAVAAVGAVPVVVAAVTGATDRMLDLVGRADALLLTGGGDVDPARYHEVAGSETGGTDLARDAVDEAAYRWARHHDRKVLAICRGIQLIAVAEGGSLHQHLPAAGFDGHWDYEREYEPSHAIQADPATLAGAALAGATKVNSIHHQGVRDPGALTPTAWSDDGLIEAVEHHRVLGIQWHPERLLDFDGRHLAPFRWLVEP